MEWQCYAGSNLQVLSIKSTQEFYRQGDQERARNLAISIFMDRNIPQIPKSQSTFIKFVISPLLSPFENVFKPELYQQLSTYLQENERRWNEKLSMPPSP